MGLPHTSSADDTISAKSESGGVKDYHIPKGSILLPNTWYFLHDPARYRNPDKFDPTRFLGEKPETDPTTFAFGYGRRICPGRVLADASGWLMMAQTLAVFNVRRKKDESGKEVEMTVEGTPGIISSPIGVQKGISVEVRNEKAKELLDRLQREVMAEGGLSSRGDSDKLGIIHV